MKQAKIAIGGNLIAIVITINIKINIKISVIVLKKLSIVFSLVVDNINK